MSVGRDWVDTVLLAGPDDEVCLFLGAPITRSALRAAIAARQEQLAAHGISVGGSIALRLPPSYAYIVNLLAGLRLGARVALLDHRLTDFEAQIAYERLRPQVIVEPGAPVTGALRAYHEVDEVYRIYPAGEPSPTGHAVLQLSSGSTGPSKVIGRSADSLVEECLRYTKMDGVPRPGERLVLLASMVHVLGLVGGLLYALHAHVELVLPERMTVDAILDAVRAGDRPTTIIGVPFHIELLASVAEPPDLPQLIGMTTGGELVRADVRTRFAERYPIRLGNMYGMTEVGVIATDLFGAHPPAVAPAPGIEVREQDGELLIRMPESPYVGLVDPERWSDGWLHTKDAGTVADGLVTIHGRRDSQIAIGGLKVDLTEVEHTIAAVPGVEAAVVVFTSLIEAYVVGNVVENVAATATATGTADSSAEVSDLRSRIEAVLAERLAKYKRPRVIHVVDALPRTITGKLVRNAAALAGSARASES